MIACWTEDSLRVNTFVSRKDGLRSLLYKNLSLDSSQFPDVVEEK